MFKSQEQLVWEKNHTDCEHHNKSDLSHYPSILGDILEQKVPFFYCGRCCTRWYKNVEYNPNEWDAYINEDTENH